MKLYIKANRLILAFHLLTILNLVTCYVVSVSLGHVYPVLPFISETGNHPPESCIFSLMSNIGSLCILVCAWLYSQRVENYVGQLRHGGQHHNILATNKIGYLIGIFTAVTMFGVANLQELNLFTIHTIAALSFFGCSALYMHIQSFISSHTQLCTPFIAKLRRRQAQLQTVLVLLTTGFASVMASQLYGKSGRDVTPSDIGYSCHALSAICEYAALLNIALFILTFYKESLHLAIQLPQVYLDGEGHRGQPSEEDSFASPSIQSAICYKLSKVIGINC